MRPKNNPGLPTWRGDALRLRRVHAGWSAQQLADRIGVSKTTICRWETGGNEPDSDRVAAMAAALDLPRTAFAKEPKIS